MAHYLGSALHDTYTGTAASDHIEGFDGDDWLKDGPTSASSVADQIFGGAGDDVITITGGADTVGGGFGQDRLIIRYELSSTDFFLNIDENTGNSIASSNGLSITGIEAFEFRLGSGNDTVCAGGGDDRFYGNDGNDVFLGRAGSDIAYGGFGGDVLLGGEGNNHLFGGDGHDVLHGGAGDDYMQPDAGADELHGDGGIDMVSYSGSSAGVIADLSAGTGDNGDAEGDTYGDIEALYGSSFGDTLTGSGNSDALDGGGGSDVLFGGAGADDLDGGAGADTASYHTSSTGVVVSLATGIGSGGEAEGDTLSGIENLSGSQGHDSLVGDIGDNVLQGRDGDDVLTGGGGKDTLTGGAGEDRFVYDSVAQSVIKANADRITDFNHAQGDAIDLSAIDASTAAAGNQAFNFIGTAAYTGMAGQLRYAQSGGVTTIAGDVDGDRSSDFHIQLTGSVALVTSDFVL